MNLSHVTQVKKSVDNFTVVIYIIYCIYITYKRASNLKVTQEWHTHVVIQMAHNFLSVCVYT